MTREELKIMAAGRFAMMNIESTIDKNDMRIFIEGAIAGFDLLTKSKDTEKIYHKPHKVEKNDNQVQA